MRISNFSKRIITALLLFAVLACYIVPVTARAEETDQKVVRVGWYDSSFNYYDQFGRRCGIDYEYQQRISAYTGWTYEYVEGSWATLLQMLIDGEIDLLGDVSYKEEREELMLYPDLPMGTESYYIYVNAKNTEITSDNLSSFNGKRVGVNKGSIQEGFLKEWAEKKNIDIEIVPVLVEENEAMNMIMNGELDGYASVYTMYADQKAIPVCRIGGSDYFYAVKKDRKDLLDELNVALAGIQEDDPYFNQRLTEERLYNSKTNISLTAIQEEWLKNHSTIRVGYRDNYLPFCDTDDKTGELIGALKDYLVHADNNLNLDIKFETKAYESTEAAIKAMKDGEVDCVFPVYLSTYDAEQMGIRLTSPAMKSEMNVVRRISDDSVLSQESQIIIAVDEGNLNIETFVKDIYPRAKIEKYKNKNACFKAVSDGKADCALISSYRLSRNDETLKKYKVFSVPTGESVQFSFAVGRNDTELYFFLNKTVAMTTADDMDAALVSYMRADEKVTFLEFMKDNMIAVIAIIIVVFSLVIFLLAQKMKAERVANRQKVLLAEAEEIADLKQTISSLLDNMPGINFTKDAGTSKYLACNQAFAEYVHKKDPSEVVGHTTREIFDEAMVKSSEEDDQIA
ncbi:MAG: transporter substrate-binding domain-containing protein, partial [Lachnospiraceae bacterium]|nr:transporter substrate-binding domain-containing protein [Lachnospiraceae bacterium]